MRILVQCVRSASVTIAGRTEAQIGRGELIYVGFAPGDTESVVDRMLARLLKARIFPDSDNKTNLTLEQVGGRILAVSQFTLYASFSSGNRPSFAGCMAPDTARKIYGYFVSELKSARPDSLFGVFQADMQVSSVNDGPFTVLLDSGELGYED